jgi:cytochrome c biogenesis factor
MSGRWAMAVLVACAILVAASHVGAQERTFTLRAGEAVTVGNYTVHFRGVFGSSPQPSYDLYEATQRIARFPSNPASANANEYVYGNVIINTSTLSRDGSVASGTITLK